MADTDMGQKWEIRYVNRLGENRMLRMFGLGNAVRFTFKFADDYGIACTVVDRTTGNVVVRMVAVPVRSN